MNKNQYVIRNKASSKYYMNSYWSTIELGDVPKIYKTLSGAKIAISQAINKMNKDTHPIQRYKPEDFVIDCYELKKISEEEL